MTRVVMGPRASRWWILYVSLFGLQFVGAALDGDWSRAVLASAVIVLGSVVLAPSLRAQTAAFAAASLLAIIAALAGGEGELFWPIFAGGMAVLLLALIPWLLRVGGGGRVRTEELVGRAVPAAERLLGFPKGRQPAGLGSPVLLMIPEGAPSDFQDSDVRAALVVTAVAVDPVAETITFGVVPRETAPKLDRRTRAALQERLVDRVGGFPADLRQRGATAASPQPAAATRR